MMRIGTFNVRDLSGKVDLVQKLVESRKLDVIGHTEIWSRPTDSFVLPMSYEALSVEPTGNHSRGNAGVALAWKLELEQETLMKHKSSNANLIVSSFGDTTVCSAYISPKATPEELHTTLDVARRKAGHKAIILGDLNALLTSWDERTNSRGSELLRWSEECLWNVNASASPSFCNTKGSSNVDLVVSRNVQFVSLSSIPDGEWIGISDHKPIIAEVSGAPLLRTKRSRKVPWWRRKKTEVAEQGKEKSELLVPLIIEQMKTVDDPTLLEGLCKQWERIVTQPHTIESIPRPHWFKSFWDHRLNGMAKKRTRMYKRACSMNRIEDWDRCRAINKKIKQIVKKKKHETFKQFADGLLRSSSTEVTKTVNRITKAKKG